jgi:hypothetical protein
MASFMDRINEKLVAPKLVALSDLHEMRRSRSYAELREALDREDHDAVSAVLDGAYQGGF